MLEVARWSTEDRRALFEEASARSGLAFDVVQKDFWVCFTLDRLFGHEAIRDSIYFKGGTSLSKCFNLIERFSEDVDLTIARAALGFKDGYLADAPSRKQWKQRKKSLQEVAEEYCSESIHPSLGESISSILPDRKSWTLADEGSGRIVFHFPVDGDRPHSDYLRPEVLLEIGGLSDLDPNEVVDVSPYAAEHVPDVFSQATARVRAVSARRTLCDKMILLHRLNTTMEEVPGEHSRHYYDVAMMARAEVREEMLGDPALLARAIAYESQTFPRTGVEYGVLGPGNIEIAPPDTHLPSLRRDYAAMTEMFFGAPPSLEEILDVLTGLEEDLRGLA